MSTTNRYTLNPVTDVSLSEKLDGQDLNSISFHDLDTLLTHIQQYRLRRPALVTKFGPVLLRRFESRLGEARSAVLREQILLAALDMHDKGLMEQMDAELAASFPGGSNRRLRLHAMRQEALSHQQATSSFAASADSPESIYEAMIDENFSNVLARKRQIALIRGQGDENKAIEALVDFLSVFQNDAPAWLELGELYASRNNIEEAKFCYEEIMTMNPRNTSQPFYVCRYAELLYALGSVKDIELVEQARCYFALSIQMQLKGNLRALYGLLVSSRYVLDSKSIQSAQKVEATASYEHAVRVR